MSQEVKLPIIPGGENSDIVDTSLGNMRHQIVQNFRLDKEDEWATVRGYVNSLTGCTDIRAAIEVHDDVSGDRFILYQDSYGANCLNRLDYDSGDGDGYENETPSTLTLPSGVTIGDVTLKFFYNQGVVRITGGSHPLWYGYANGDFCPDAWRLMDEDSFETDIESWYGHDANPTQYDCVADADGAGMVTGKYGTKALRIEQIGLDGSGNKIFTTKNGLNYKVSLWIYRPADASANYTYLYVGSTVYGYEYGEDSTNTKEAWVKLEVDFTATQTGNAYIQVIVNGESDLVFYVDWVLIQEQGLQVFDGWYLRKAEVTDWLTYVVDSTDYKMGSVSGTGNWYSYYYAIFFILDDGQFTLPILLSGEEDVNQEENSNYKWSKRFSIKITETEFESVGSRIRGAGLLISRSTTPMNIDVNDLVWYVADYINVSLDVDPIVRVFQPDLRWHVEATDPSYAHAINYPGDYCIAQNFVGAGDLPIMRECNILRALCSPNKRVLITGEGGSKETTINNVGFYYDSTFSLLLIFCNDDMSSIEGIGSDPISIKIYNEPTFRYESAARTIRFDLAVELYDMPTVEYSELAGYNINTKSINPDYSQHRVINGFGICNSQEDKETIFARYSPANQPDVFPEENLIDTAISGSNEIIDIRERDNRLVMLTKDSITQRQVDGNNFYVDITIKKRGLYATNGVIEIDNVLYIMDTDDVYMFSGGMPSPLIGPGKNREYYRSYVNANSFFGYNPIDHELWLFLNGTIMVYQFDFQIWYRRATTLTTPRLAFNLYDRLLYVCSGTKFVRYNHSETTFGENIQGYIKTGLEDLKDPDLLKKAKKLIAHCMGNKNITAVLSDPVKAGADDFSEAKTPKTTYFDYAVWKPNYLFRGLEIELQTGSTTTTNVKLKKSELIVDVINRNA